MNPILKQLNNKRIDGIGSRHRNKSQLDNLTSNNTPNNFGKIEIRAHMENL